MIRLSGMKMPLTYTEKDLLKAAARMLHLSERDITCLRVVKRSVDARHKQDITFSFTVDVSLKGGTAAEEKRVKTVPAAQMAAPFIYSGKKAEAKPSHAPVVIGSGPAGLFAGLILARAGLSPLILERGEDVDRRQQDVEHFRLTGQLSPASNVQFGEGGAGTFSDGKLNTGIKDPRCRLVLEELAAAGAPESILWQAKPHVGTDKLRQAVKGLRQEIIRLGGRVCFGWQVTGLQADGGKLVGISAQTPEGKKTIPCRQAILAIGHSARDTLSMLYEAGIVMEQKPFAVGVRIEHPRQMIDESQYGRFAGHPALGAADYKLSCRPRSGRGVYTFCMCPGGVVIAAASEEGGVAVNGMSEYARDAMNSNSALLVGVGLDAGDYNSAHPLAGVALQRQMEQAAFRLGGGGYKAPVQMVGDFLKDRPSQSLGEVQPSYRPGVTPADLRECLPSFVADNLKAALPALGQQLRGFDRYDALLTGVESRSSSPVRLKRHETGPSRGQSSLAGLYPCGEGAGYAGGIMSAAVDGVRCAEWVIEQTEEFR